MNETLCLGITNMIYLLLVYIFMPVLPIPSKDFTQLYSNIRKAHFFLMTTNNLPGKSRGVMGYVCFNISCPFSGPRHCLHFFSVKRSVFKLTWLNKESGSNHLTLPNFPSEHFTYHIDNILLLVGVPNKIFLF
jgi:hypothetical protein